MVNKWELMKSIDNMRELKTISGGILGQNYVCHSNAAFSDLSFSKVCFIKSSVNMLWT